MFTRKFLFSLLFIVFYSNLSASIDDYFPYNIGPSASNYGETGLIEIPNARFMESGSLSFNYSSSYPNEFTGLTASPFSWMEATYRYVEIKNQKYGQDFYSGNQTYKDKGFDVKIRLNKESYFSPQFALGLRDIAGTGIFSSEYLVASKSFGSLDLTAGLGWGVLGLEGNYSNPFMDFNERFSKRSISTSSEGGEFNYKDWFSGDMSLFSGLEYDLSKYGLRLKLEYDTSNPDKVLSRRVPLKVSSRFNIGADYFLSESFVLGLAFERGNQLRFSFKLTGNFSKDTIRKPPPKNVLKLNEGQLRRVKENKSIFYKSLNLSLREESIFIQGASLDDDSVDVAVSSPKFMSLMRLAGRSARIASALAPEEIEELNIHIMNGNFEASIIKLNRAELDKAHKFKSSSSEILEDTTLNSNSSNPIYLNADFQPTVNFPQISWNMTPAFRHQIGGPEGFYLGQLWWKTDLNINFSRNLTLYSTVGVDIYNNFDELNQPSDSKIAKVRSDIQEYLKEGETNLARFKLEYMFSPYKDIFVKAELGMLEEMFGGFGGEIYYRPFNRKFSLSLNAHKVKQRDYDQKLSFKEYTTTTSNVSLYYDFFEGISGQFLYGKYLAGDKGITVDLSRRFKSGFTLGIFATKTDLSVEEFGEGSFDKGFYFSIPTNLFYSDYRQGTIPFGLHPLTKDGGSLLNYHNSLYSLLGETTKKSLLRDWKDILN